MEILKTRPNDGVHRKIYRRQPGADCHHKQVGVDATAACLPLLNFPAPVGKKNLNTIHYFHAGRFAAEVFGISEAPQCQQQVILHHVASNTHFEAALGAIDRSKLMIYTPRDMLHRLGAQVGDMLVFTASGKGLGASINVLDRATQVRWV